MSLPGTGIGRIGTYAHDLGIQSGELRQVCLIRRHLDGSSGAEIDGIERQHHVLAVAIVAEMKFLSAVAQYPEQFEIGATSPTFRAAMRSSG